MSASIRSLNPLRLFQRHPYQRLPSSYDGSNGSASSSSSRNTLSPDDKRKDYFPAVIGGGSPTQRSRWCRLSLRIIPLAILLILALIFFGRRNVPADPETHPVAETSAEEHANTRYWEVFPRLDGYFRGVKSLVPWNEWRPDELQKDHWGYMNDPGHTSKSLKKPLYGGSDERNEDKVKSPLPMAPMKYNPFPFNSSEYLKDYEAVAPCYLDEAETLAAPDIFVYPGMPQGMVMPFLGEHEELGLRGDVCFERFGRYGPYGYGYNAAEGGLGLGLRSEQEGAENVWQLQGKIDYQHNIDWGHAQDKCLQKNKHRFTSIEDRTKRDDKRQTGLKKKLPRQAYVLRAWTGFEYTAHEILTLRAMITELSLKSGGEYDVHILLHVRDDSIPIWTSKEVYQNVIAENIPPEFWGITTLWSVQQMRLYYPGPFGEPPANIAGQEIHGVYRSAHFAMQWFAQEHPEYDFVWNWEMDMRYSGHYWEFHNGVANWAKQQPRKGLWERNEKIWIPALHGDWANFTKFVDKETMESGGVPVWGPVTFPNSGMMESPNATQPPHSYFDDNFEWGVGEEADLITFNPIFDPSKTNWVFRKDISGYDLNLPIPPRRCAIITVSRLSRRLLDMMHEETYIGKHSAFPEMWPPTVALHHGMKAVYAPHPVYFDRKWPLDYMDQIFNYPENKINSPFGWGEHNWLGGSFYYNAGFSGALWRRWLGEKENDEGGAGAEIGGTGRLCLRSTLHHPIKNENNPE